MYLYMNDVKTGESNIHLVYPIENFDNSKEIAIVNFFQDTATWNIKSDVELELGSEKSSITLGKKQIKKKHIH